jgi:hypothetical protein
MNWLLIGASVAALILGLFLRIDASPRVRRVGWSIFAAIALMTVIGQWLDSRAPRLHLGLLGPQLSVSEGYEHAMGHASDRDELRLLDAIGSYYTCVRKPDSIFLQFCEWVFVFRRENSKELVEYRVLDSRMPQLPVLPAGTTESTAEGGFATYVLYNVPPEALGIHPTGEANAAIRQYDAKGRVVVTTMGTGPQHSFAEITEGPNEFVICLTRACGRPTDHLAKSTVVERWNRLGDVVIYRATHEQDAFYDSLKPIELTLGAQDAITLAMRTGADFEVPGKRMVSATAVRLHDGRDQDVAGPRWRIPLRMALRPIVVHATSGRVYFVADDGEYKAYWSTRQYLPELVAGMLFLILLSLCIHVLRQSRLRRGLR